MTSAIAVLYRIGTFIPVPGVDPASIATLRREIGPGTLGPSDLVTAGNLTSVSVFASDPAVHLRLDVVQLSFAAWRALTKGRWTLAPSYVVPVTGIAAVALCAMQSYGVATFLEVQSRVPMGLALVVHPGWSFRLVAVVTLTAVWRCSCAERLHPKRGTANGMLVTFVAGIVAGLSRHRRRHPCAGAAAFLDSGGSASRRWPGLPRGYRAAFHTLVPLSEHVA